MTFALPGVGDRIVVKTKYVDEAAQIAQTDTEIPFDTDLTTTINNAIAHVDLLATLSGALVDTASITITITDAVAAAAAAKSDVGHDGQLVITLDTTGASKTKAGVVHVPAPKDGVRVATTGKQFYLLNTGHADVLALFANFQAAGDATISDGQKALAISSGEIRASRRKKRPV